MLFEAAMLFACVYVCEWGTDVLENRVMLCACHLLRPSVLQPLPGVWFCETQTVHIIIFTSSLLVLGMTTEVSTYSNTLHVYILIDVHLLLYTLVCGVCLKRAWQAGMCAVHRCRLDVIEHDEEAVYA